MSNQHTICDPRRIEQLLEDELDAREQETLESHLDECVSCRETLQAAAAEPTMWRSARQYLSDVDDPVGATTAPEQEERREIDGGIALVVSQLAPSDDPRMLGRLGGYEIVGVVGCGGMGVVLKGFDAPLNRYVAIKILAPHLATSGAARQRFAREARAAAAVVHENIVAIHAVAESNGVPYFVMPYARGVSLQTRIDCQGPLSPVEVLRVAVQVAAGLSAAHAQGLVHRDIKPANILLEDGVERLLITDFGLARAADDASLTRSGVIAGTPQYMSPEQARGDAIDERSDLFSLGSVMYAMCTGHPPFRAETSYGVLRRIGEDEPRPLAEINNEVPSWLAAVVARLLCKTPGDRFADARQVEDLLRRCLAHLQQPNASPLPAELAPTKAGLWTRRKFAAGVALVTVGLLAVAIIAVGSALRTIEAPAEAMHDKRLNSGRGAAVEPHVADKLDSTMPGDDESLSEAALTWDDGIGEELLDMDQALRSLEQRAASPWTATRRHTTPAQEP